MLLIFLSTIINLFAAVGNYPSYNVELIVKSFLNSDLENCKRYYSDCENLFELGAIKKAAKVELKMKSAAVFGTVFEFSQICGEGDKSTCTLVQTVFSDSEGGCSKLSANKLLCSDLWSYRFKKCNSVNDDFLKSICQEKLTDKCRKDLSCTILWSYSNRMNSQKMLLVPEDIRSAFNKVYAEDKATLVKNIDILKSRVVNSPVKTIEKNDFPSPGKINSKVLDNIKKPIQASRNTIPVFKQVASIKAFGFSSMRYHLHPWKRGEGIAAVDWNGDGLMDIFTVAGENILFFQNIDGKIFKKFSINLSSAGLKGALIDISVADIDGNGTPAIIAQSFPNQLLILRWSGQSGQYLIEPISLPNHSRTHAFVKLKSGLGIIFPGWNGISGQQTSLSRDYIAKIENKKWEFKLIQSSGAPSLGVNVVDLHGGQQVVIINKDLEGGMELFSVQGDELIKNETSEKINKYAHSSGYLYNSNKEDVWVTSGLNFQTSNVGSKKTLSSPKTIEECVQMKGDEEKKFCVLRRNKWMTTKWDDLCSMYLDLETRKICVAQNEVPSMFGIKKFDPTNFKAKIFKDIKSPIIDESGSKIVSEMGLVWHLSPLQSPNLEGFLMSESNDGSSLRKLWWVSIGKKGVKKTDLTASLGMKSPYDATQFVLVDFDNDGQLDMVFKSGEEMVFLKGNTNGYSLFENNLQMGHQSRTLIKIPSNKLE